MGSKSKRRHANKQYNRARNKQPAQPVAAAEALTADETTPAVTAPVILTAKELRAQEKARLQNEKQARKAQAKADKASEKNKGEKKPFFLVRFFRWLGRSLGEIGSELKKVHWPSFKQTMKATGIVLAIVLFFGILLFGIWELLGLLYKLLIS